MADDAQAQLRQNLLDAARNLRTFQLAEIRVQRILKAAQAKLTGIRETRDQAWRDLQKANEAHVFAEFGLHTLLQEQVRMRQENHSGIAFDAQREAKSTLMLSCVNTNDDAILTAALQYGERQKQYNGVVAAERAIALAVTEAAAASRQALAAKEEAQKRLDDASAAYTATMAEVEAIRATLPSQNINHFALHNAVQAAALTLSGIPLEDYCGWYKLDSAVPLTGDQTPSLGQVDAAAQAEPGAPADVGSQSK